MSYQFAYLVADLMLLAVWLALFVARKDLRRKMLLVSIVIGFMGPISEFWYHVDYWKPEVFLGRNIGFEDYLFGFTMGGIASVLYQIIFSMRSLPIAETRRLGKFAVLGLVMTGSTVLASILMFRHGLNSIYASSLGMALVALAIIFMRRDLILSSLLSGALLSATFFFEYMIMLRIYPELFRRWWFLDNLSGMTVAQVPMEELIWAFALGMMMGPIYEFLTGRHMQKLSVIQ